MGELGLVWTRAVGELFGEAFICSIFSSVVAVDISSFLCSDAFLVDRFLRAVLGVSFCPFLEAEPRVVWFRAELGAGLVVLAAALLEPLLLSLEAGLLVGCRELRREDERVTGGVCLCALGCFNDFTSLDGFVSLVCRGGRAAFEVESFADGGLTDFGFCAIVDFCVVVGFRFSVEVLFRTSGSPEFDFGKEIWGSNGTLLVPATNGFFFFSCSFFLASSLFFCHSFSCSMRRSRLSLSVGLAGRREENKTFPNHARLTTAQNYKTKLEDSFLSLLFFVQKLPVSSS